MAELTISRLASDQVGPCARALARAFDDDPLTNFLLPHPTHRPRVLAAVFAAQIRDGLAGGEVWAALDGDVPVAAAVWIPPESWPMSLSRELRILGSVIRPGWRSVGHALRAAPRFVRIMATVERLHPKRPQWYLALLGTDPDYQGRGAGSQLLAPVLERCDEQGLHAYLETGTEKNVAWYSKQRFAVVEELRPIRDSPRLWTMERVSEKGA